MSTPHERSPITLASDPLNFEDITTFEFPGWPEYRVQPDSDFMAEVKVGDGGYRQDVIGEPGRNIELVLSGADRWTGQSLEAWRLLRRTGHFLALYPNYDGSTLALNHFESSLVAEVGQTPTLNVTPSYVNGVLGAALKLYGDSQLVYNATLPTTGSLNLWLQFPADGSWASLNGVFLAGPNMWAGWSHWDNVLTFRCNGTFSYDVTATANQLPTLAAGEWFNLGLSWRSGASRRARIVINGDAAYTFEKALNADPTVFNGTFGIGYAYVGSSEYYNGTLDEVRLQSAFWSTDEHGSCYDRMAYSTLKTLAGQGQGQYLRVVADQLGLLSRANSEYLVGRLMLGVGYVDDTQIVSMASGTWPSS